MRDVFFRIRFEFAEVFGEFFSFGVEQVNRRVSLVEVFFFKRGVLFLESGGLFGFLREIRFHQDQVLGGVVLEGLLREDIFFDLDAPSAPVGAGQVDEDRFVLGFGFGLGGFPVGGPAVGAGEGERSGGGKDGEGS